VDALIEELQQLSEAEPTKRSGITLDERKLTPVAHSNPELDRTLEHSYWVALGDSADFSDYAEFLERFPSGVYAPLARKRFEAGIAKAQREPIERFLHERPVSSFATRLRAQLATIEWADLGQERSAAKLRAFIERHFDSVEAGQAKAELAKIEWKRLSQSEDVVEINRILPDLGDSPEADLARRRLDALKLETEQWDAAVAANSVTSFQTYLAKFPRGKHSSDAKQLLNAAEIASTRQRQAEVETPSEPAKGKDRSWLFGDVRRRLFVAAVLVLALAGVAVFWPRSTPNLAPSQESSQSPPASNINPQAGDRVQAPPHESDAATPPLPKISERFGQAQSQPDQSKVQEAAAPGQVVLYEEDPHDANGKRYPGTVAWSLENVAASPGQPVDKAIRGNISIPERNMRMTLTIRRKADKDPLSSHTVSINFTLPADFSHRGIQKIPGLLMKQSESERGVPLASQLFEVTAGGFLIGLSSADGEFQRNIQILKERGWFDIPIVYSDNRRAILAVEKGPQGDQVFRDAFAAWRQ
jgi:outer membrane protein assembly factor BamD (BamD/ComL family)